jgi:hypothetical protein
VFRSEIGRGENRPAPQIYSFVAMSMVYMCEMSECKLKYVDSNECFGNVNCNSLNTNERMRQRRKLRDSSERHRI